MQVWWIIFWNLNKVQFKFKVMHIPTMNIVNMVRDTEKIAIAMKLQVMNGLLFDIYTFDSAIF